MSKNSLDELVANIGEELRKPQAPTSKFELALAGIFSLGAGVALAIARLRYDIPWGTTSLLNWLLVGGVIMLIYCLPSLIAHKRNHPQLAALIALNLAGGLVFVGWVAALVWVLLRDKSELKE